MPHEQRASRGLRYTLLSGLVVTAALGVAPVIDLVSVAMAQDERVIPPAYGLLWALPVAIGAVAVVMVFRTRRAEPSK